MSQTKYKLPDDTKMQCIAIVRGYERRKQEYHHKRNDIMYGSPPPPDGQPRGGGMGNGTCQKAIKLTLLESAPDTRLMRAVEHAQTLIGNDIISDSERAKLRSAIWDSCIEGRNFVFEYYPLAMGKTCFYEYRRKFLHDIADYLGYVKKTANCATKK